MFARAHQPGREARCGRGCPLAGRLACPPRRSVCSQCVRRFKTAKPWHGSSLPRALRGSALRYRVKKVQCFGAFYSLSFWGFFYSSGLRGSRHPSSRSVGVEGFWLGQKASPGAEHGAGNRSPAREHVSRLDGYLLTLPEIPSNCGHLGGSGRGVFSEGKDNDCCNFKGS